MAQDALYHVKCLTSLYRRAEKENTCEHENQDNIIHGIALAELVAYIDDARADSGDSQLVIKLADLAKMYTLRLSQLGVEVSGRVQTAHLKNRILDQFPDMEAHTHGRDVLLAFNEGIGLALNAAYTRDFDNDGVILAKAATIVRRDILNRKSVCNGSFDGQCQQKSVPLSLTTLVWMILGGPNIKTQSSKICDAQAPLSVAQLLELNSTISRREGSSTQYHTKSREPPLPIYTGLLVHAETRKRGLIDKLHELGLCISYNRILVISTGMGNGVCEQFEKENLVWPPKLRKDIFTTSAVDNIDHNPSYTTAQVSLHGTGLSIFQHSTSDCIGEERGVVILQTDGSKTILSLPESYTSVPPMNFREKEPIVPDVGGSLSNEYPHFSENMTQQFRWLDHTKDVCQAEVSGAEQDMETSWAAYHASKTDTPNTMSDAPVYISALLPLFQEQAKSPAMIRHSMNVIQRIVHFLNPGQTPVIACDQPLYAVAKLIQWNWPDTHGEDRFVIMFGGLHIEMAALKALGGWLQDSCWTAAVADANIASSGSADSLLKAVHVTRTRHAHQITASSLYILMNNAFTDYLTGVEEGEDPLTFDEWRVINGSKSPQFLYWSITLNFELKVLVFVQSNREGNFSLHKEALAKLIPWFFALNHTHYSRWLPIHLGDMMALSDTHPNIAKEFETGIFVVHKTHNIFSAIAIDQAHDQNNKCVKGDGGAVGLTENSAELLRWMVSGPEIARVIGEFEASLEDIKRTQSANVHNHEQVKSVQMTFKTQVRGGDFDEFFSHENQAYPPALSQFGQIRCGTKSDLTHCLEKLVEVQESNPDVQALLLDGAALVHMLKPGATKTFHAYAHDVFIKCIKSQHQHFERIDIIWDVYTADSLKTAERAKRGTGTRRRVHPVNNLPSNWESFLKVDENKTELFKYLAQVSTNVEYGDRQLISTYGDTVLCSKDREITELSPCTHEEADTRLLLHAAECVGHGHRRVMIRTVDTYVVVIAVSLFRQLEITELWIAFGVGKNFRHIPIHAIAEALGSEKSTWLLVFHAITGCDQTSSFAGRGKNTAWQAWRINNDVTESFVALSNTPTAAMVEQNMPSIERFVIVMYERTNICQTVNEARKDLFSRKCRAIDTIPPTSAALLEHTKRAAYQAGHCWGQSLMLRPDIPSPADWGWKRSTTHTWEPLWTTLPEASKVCQELSRCGCQSVRGCVGHCKCVKACMKYTSLCKCGGDCERD